MVFRATESDLRRLLKGEESAEKASNQDLEALEVLRGSERFLKGCTDGTDNWNCDEDTQKCGDSKDECKEVCDDNKCGHGECKKGDCKCDNGYEGKRCEDQVVEYNIRLFVDETTTRTGECEQALDDLKKSLKDLPDTIRDKSGKHRRDRRLGNSKGYKVDIIINVDNTCTTRGVGDGVTGLLDQLEAQLPKGIKIKNTGGSRDM